MKIDFNAINETLLRQSLFFVREWLPGGKEDGAEYIVRNPKRQDDKPGSFKINTDTGVWKDFASGDGGGDLISLYAWLNNLNQGEAAKALAEQLGSAPAADNVVPFKKRGRPVWTAVMPVPKNAPKGPEAHSRYGKPSKVWAYRSPAGDTLGYVYRFDPKGARKQVLPLVWARSEDGREAWQFQGFPEPRPLYRLDSLAMWPDAVVVVCEGEKAADAASRLLPDYAATTSPGGCKAWKKADWSPLAGREVLIWPDNDAEGMAYAREVTKILEGLDCRVSWLRIPEGKPEGWDAADAEAEGISGDWLKNQITSGALAGKPPQLGQVDNSGGCPFEEKDAPWPEFRGEGALSVNGVADRNYNLIVLRPLWVDAMTVNFVGTWGMLVKFYDVDWREHHYAFSLDKLHEQGGVLGRELAVQGLPIVPGKEKWVSRYLSFWTTQTKKRIRAAGRIGWIDSGQQSVFVLPQQVLGRTEQPIVYQPESISNLVDTLHMKGDLIDWRREVAGRCRGNPMLMFALMVGLSGPLLKPCQEQSGGWHIYGVTTGGKTTMAQVCASVWGCGADPQEGPEITSVRKWHATANALESLAEAHNDCVLCLDEISEVDPYELGRVIYQLAGGLSKSRSNVSGGLRAIKTWRLMFLSTGEKSVRQMLATAGQAQKGGQRVRMPDIPADDEQGQRSIVRESHGQEPKYFVRELKAACTQSYGLAGPTLVAALIGEAEQIGWAELSEKLGEELKVVERSLNDINAALPPEGGRVLRRFALVALAGLRARQAGILDWSIEEIVLAVREVRDRWLSDQGEERSEMDRAFAHLRDQLIKNEHRFVWLVDAGGQFPYLERAGASKQGRVRDMIGFRTATEYGLTEAGLRELCGEYDMRSTLRALREAGYLRHDAGKLTRKWSTIEGYDRVRPYLYSIYTKFLGEEAEGWSEGEAQPQAAGEGCPF